jgi:transglutaminase-like putative cysteine protease
MRLRSCLSLSLLCCVVLIPAAAQKPLTGDTAFLTSFAIKFTMSPAPGAKTAKLITLLPRTIEGRQNILEIKYSLVPSRRFLESGNTYVEFTIDDPQTTKELTISIKAEIHRYDLSVAATNNALRQFDDKDELNAWRIDEQFLEKDAPMIQKAAKGLLGRTEEETIRKTMAFVVRTLRKTSYDPVDHGAVWALEQKHGDCTEFSDLFVSLCRANGLPARTRSGYLIHDVPKGDTPKHDWAEVYVAKYGWVPFDPLHVHQGDATVDRLRPIYVYFENQRRNATLNNFHYFFCTFQGGPVGVDSEFELKSRKAMMAK